MHEAFIAMNEKNAKQQTFVYKLLSFCFIATEMYICGNIIKLGIHCNEKENSM